MLPPFERVVAEHGATVLRVCRAVLRGSDEAEDAWSETFLAALKAYPRLPPGANVQAWLVTIASRKAIDVTRARRWHPLPVGTVPEAVARDGVPESVLDEQHAWATVRALPERQRLAVAYHHLGGLPYADVAALIGGTPEAARRAAADGIARLRRERALEVEPQTPTRSGGALGS